MAPTRTLLRLSAALALSLAVLWPAPVWAKLAWQPPEEGLEALRPTGAQRARLREILTQVRRQHYAKKRVSELNGASLFESMMEVLDSGNRVFLQDEVEEMRRRYVPGLERTLSRSDLKAPFAIYNIWRKRMVDLRTRQFDLLREEAVDVYEPAYFRPDTSEEPRLLAYEDLEDYWDRQLKYALVSRLVQHEDPSAVGRLQTARMRNLLKNLYELDDEDAFHTSVSAVFHQLDPHTAYLTPEDAREWRLSLGAQLEGIGAVLTVRDDYVEVVRLIPGGPAMRSGEILPGDRIVAVTNEEGELEDVVGMRLNEVVRMIKGDKGTPVSLEVIGGAPFGGPSRQVDLIREVIKPEDQTARGEVLDVLATDGVAMRIGVLELPRFYGRIGNDQNSSVAHEDLRKLIDEMEEQGAQGIVLDLRGNGGGFLKEAIDVSGLFLRSGKVVQVHDNRGRIKPEGRFAGRPKWQGPFAVLVDRLSASASEIVTAAIQDYERGLVIGTSTFGKGTVQGGTAISREGGQVNITQSMYYRVTGDTTQNVGVVPDVTLPRIYSPEHIGESSYETSLPRSRLHTSAPRPYDDWHWDAEKLQRAHVQRRHSTPGLAYLIDRTAMQEMQSDREEVPIWVEGYNEMVQDDRQERLDLENELRESYGEEPFADWWAYLAHLRELARDPDRHSIEDLVLRREAARVLADQIAYQTSLDGSNRLVQARQQP